MFAKIKCLKNDEVHIFEKPLTIPFQIYPKFSKIKIA